MPNHASTKRKCYFLFISFLTLYILSVLVHLNYPLLAGEEPRRAMVTIEMMRSGNYTMPSLLGYDYFNKPPLYNWIMSAFLFITGSASEWAVRLPSLLFLLLLAGCHYLIAKRFLPKTIAALSALFTLTSIDIYFYGLQNGGEIDIFYAFIVYIQVISLFYYSVRQKWLYVYLLSYLFCAIGFLTKGCPSLLFQVLTLLALCVYYRSFKILFCWQHLAGLLIFAVVTGFYLYLFSFYNAPQRLLINLLNESFKKSAVGELSERLWSKAIAYPGMLIKFLLPWSLLLLLFFKRLQLYIRSNPLVRFSILFILFNIGVYWFTGKPKLRYVYMFLPFFATLLAYVYWKYKCICAVYIQQFFKYSGFIFVIVLCGIAALPFFKNVNFLWVGLSGVVMLIFSIIYFRQVRHSVWLFAMGIVLTRLVFAALVVPMQHEQSRKRYDIIVNDIIKAAYNQPVAYWSPPTDSLRFVIDVKFRKWQYGSVASPPEFHFQIPYYYYKATGVLMKYESSINPDKAYITFKEWLGNRNVNVLWTYQSTISGKELVLFNIND